MIKKGITLFILGFAFWGVGRWILSDSATSPTPDDSTQLKDSSRTIASEAEVQNSIRQNPKDPTSLSFAMQKALQVAAPEAPGPSQPLAIPSGNPFEQNRLGRELLTLIRDPSLRTPENLNGILSEDPELMFKMFSQTLQASDLGEANRSLLLEWSANIPGLKDQKLALWTQILEQQQKSPIGMAAYNLILENTPYDSALHETSKVIQTCLDKECVQDFTQKFAAKYPGKELEVVQTVNEPQNHNTPSHDLESDPNAPSHSEPIEPSPYEHEPDSQSNSPNSDRNSGSSDTGESNSAIN